MAPPEAPAVPKLPPWEKLKVFIEGAIWATGAAMVPVLYVIWQDVQDNEFTDWRKTTRLAIVSAGTALVGYWRKYEAWLAAPPGTDIVKSTETEIKTPGAPTVTVSSTEQLGLVAKPEEPKA